MVCLFELNTNFSRNISIISLNIALYHNKSIIGYTNNEAFIGASLFSNNFIVLRNKELFLVHRIIKIGRDTISYNDTKRFARIKIRYNVQWQHIAVLGEISLRWGHHAIFIYPLLWQCASYYGFKLRKYVPAILKSKSI